MSAPLPTLPATVAPGQIQFLDSIQPPLAAGRYTFEAEQKVVGLPEVVAPYQASQAIEIVAPRFSLDPTAISSVYPPANQVGNYQNQLPNVVFTDFALPWSRSLVPGAAVTAGSPPWLALLLVHGSEIAQVSAPRTLTVAELVKPGPGIAGPELGATVDAASQQPVVAIDIDGGLFRGIAPRLAELPYLAHGRVVDTGGKPLLGMDADGCFALVVGNRVPGFSATAPVDNHVFLVSLEGHQNRLPGGADGSAAKIRLALLGSWKFTLPATTVAGSFLGLMESLCLPGQGGVKLLQAPQAATPTGDAQADRALAIGYVPLRNELRDGEKTTSWYRGPAVPAPTRRDREYGPYHASDHALQYDPETGLFDASYACAWQIGRLMALADGSFARQLFAWRRDYLSGYASQARDAAVRRPLALVLAGAARAAFGDAAGEDDLELPAALRRFFAALPAGVLEAIPKSPPRGRREELARMPGALPTERLARALDDGADPLLLLLQHLAPSESDEILPAP